MKFDMMIVWILPLAGTCLGSALVFLIKNKVPDRLEKSMLGFAAGVMVAAAFFSLLLPGMEQAEQLGLNDLFVGVAGFGAGMLFLLVLDEVIPHMHVHADQAEGPEVSWKKTTKLFFAMTLHNIPEGMSLGIVLAAAVSGQFAMSASAALALAMGIAVQNVPEGAVLSLPLHQQGMKKTKAFWMGCASGAVEPLGALLTLAFSAFLEPVLPFLLTFASGAMIYVCVEELIPQSQAGHHSNVATIAFSAGFVLMMILDKALG